MNLPNSVNNIAERIRALLSGLTPRDRGTLLFGITVVLLVGAWFAVNSMQKSTRQLNRNLEAAQTAQKEVEGLLGEFQSRGGDADKLEAKLQAGKDFTPLTWLEKVGNEMGISANIRSMTERGVIETDYYLSLIHI